MRYCIVGDTLINTNKGIKRIQDLVLHSELNSDNDIDIFVKSIDGKNNKAIKLFNSGIHETITVELENGLKITGTENHPLLVLDEFDKPSWKLIRDLKINDRCVIDIDASNAYFGENNDLEEARRLAGDIFINEISFEKVFEGTREYQIEFLKGIFNGQKFFIHDNIEYLRNIQLILMTNFGRPIKVENNKLELTKIKDYSKVKSLCLDNKQIVYSVKVDSDCHSFSANGFFNHNTEARLSKISAQEIVAEVEYTVPYQPNFDETEKEPVVLPVKYPNLLVNGTEGIAVGLTAAVPPHNLIETNNMIIAFIKKDPSKEKRALGKENPITIAELLVFLSGPDFPTGGRITNKKDLLDIYTTGEGKISVRGKIEEEVINGRTALIITEIPYSSSGRKEALVSKIAELILNKKIEDVNEIRDESDANIRIVIDCKKGADLEKIKNKLYKLSPLQDTISVKMNAIRKCGFKTFNLKDYCREFVDFQREIYTKEFQARLKKAEEKAEILEGFMIVKDYIDVIIDAIRHAEKIEYAKNCLMTGSIDHINFQIKKHEKVAKTFSFTEAQSEAILSTTLRRLNNLEFVEMAKKLDELKKNIDKYKEILSDEKQLDKTIIAKLQALSKEYGTPRKTIIEDSTIVEYVEAKKYEPCNVVFDKFGYIKILDDSNYNKLEPNAFENCKLDVKTTTEDYLWAFTDKGFMYQIKLDGIPFNKTKDRGFFLENKIGKNIEGEVIYVSTKMTTAKELIFLSKKGFIKRVPTEEFVTIRTITNSTKLGKDDDILKIFEVKDLKDDIVIATNTNYLRFSISEISELKKVSQGIVSIKTTTDLTDACIITEETPIITLNNKTIETKDIKKQKRGGKGTKF
jgi:DNA gyrase subunit A